MIKKLTLLATIILSLCCVTQSEAAIASACILDVSTSEGDDANGGGYNPYKATTDYSNQAAAQISVTDAYATGATTILYSATGGFVTNPSTGNIVQISTGTNVLLGFYEIVSVGNDNYVVLDRNWASAETGTNAVLKLGGKLKTLWPIQDTATSPIVAGNIVYVKSGTYTRFSASNSVLSLKTSGAAGTPISVVGYNNIRDDHPTGWERPYLNAEKSATNVINGTFQFTDFYNLILGNATGVGLTGGGTNECLLYNCKIFNSGSHGIQIAVLAIIDCESNNNNGYGFWTGNASSSQYAYGFFTHNNSNRGWYGQGSTVRGNLNQCISDSNINYGFSTTTTFRAINCIATNNTGATSDGFYISGSASIEHGYIINTISSNNGGSGWNLSGVSAPAHIINYNCSNGNSSVNKNLPTPYSPSDKNIVSNPLFNNTSEFDFTLKTNSDCIGAGFKSSYATSPVGDYHWNIGIDQGDHRTLSSGSAS